VHSHRPPAIDRLSQSDTSITRALPSAEAVTAVVDTACSFEDDGCRVTVSDGFGDAVSSGCPSSDALRSTASSFIGARGHKIASAPISATALAIPAMIASRTEDDLGGVKNILASSGSLV